MRQHTLCYLAHYNLLQMKIFYVGQALLPWRPTQSHKEISAALGLIPVIQSTPKFQLCRDFTESQNGRGWKGPLWVISSNSPAEAGSPTAGCTGPCPGGSWISPEKETPQPPWAACSNAPSPSEWRSSSSCSDGTSCASVWARCPLSCRWAPLKRVRPHPPDTHPWDIYKHLLGPLSAFSSSGWTSLWSCLSKHSSQSTCARLSIVDWTAYTSWCKTR